MTTFISVHSLDVQPPKISASAGGTFSAPLQISIRAADGALLSEITIFTENQRYADALVAAINGVEAPVAKAPSKVEAA